MIRGDSQVDNFLLGNIEKTVAMLERGGVVIFPTETVYALACDALNHEAVLKIYKIKKRQESKPLAILCSSIDMAEQYAEIDDISKMLLLRFSPGPITIICKKNNSKVMAGNEHSVGIRIPDNDIALSVINKFGRPIAATSANISGEYAATTPEQLEVIAKEVDFAFIGGNSEQGVNSTVVDTTTSQPRILRQGSLTEDSILSYISEVIGTRGRT